MTSLGDLLELIHDAALRSSSVRAVVRETRRTALEREAVERGRSAPAQERPPLPESVTLLYSRDDGGEHLQLHEAAAELEWTGAEPRRLTRGGRTYLAFGPEEPEGLEPAQLLFPLYGTRIRMSSSELSLGRLLELAEALVEA